MMKKLYYLILMIPFMLNGCLNYSQETKLKTDGSGEMAIHYWAKIKTADDSVMVNRFGYFNKDSLNALFSSKYDKISKIEIYNDSNDTTVHAKIEISFSSIDSLNKMRPFRDANFSFKDGAANQKIFSQFVSPAASVFSLQASGMTATYTYYLPGEVIAHNAHNLKGNKLTWVYKLSDIGTGKTLTATIRPFKLKETPVWIYAAALIVLLVVTIFLFKKNKS
jgi:hypothetical protein